MNHSELLSKSLDSDISIAHDRFIVAMQQRLPAMSLETKERYFAMLSLLVGKLELPEKELRQILQEVMTEALGIIMQELGASS